MSAGALSTAAPTPKPRSRDCHIIASIDRADGKRIRLTAGQEHDDPGLCGIEHQVQQRLAAAQSRAVRGCSLASPMLSSAAAPIAESNAAWGSGKRG